MRPAVAALGAPERAGLDRLAGLSDGPVIFAANHHSHLDTPLMLTSLPEPWRHKVFVAAAADYFFTTQSPRRPRRSPSAPSRSSDRRSAAAPPTRPPS